MFGFDLTALFKLHASLFHTTITTFKERKPFISLMAHVLMFLINHCLAREAEVRVFFLVPLGEIV